MKKLFFLLPLLAIAFNSCSKGGDNENLPQTPVAEAESYTVSLAMKGDVTITETPLSRAPGLETASRDLYGINVYYDKEKDGNLDDGYGSGLFDNVADMSISLLTGYKYKFVCTLIKNGKDKLYYRQKNEWNYTSGYYNPFGSHNYSDAAAKDVENQFTLGGLYLYDLGSGVATINREAFGAYNCNYPETDRYYGEITNYTPSDNGIVNIEMKRCVFGAEFIINGISDGTLYIHSSDIFSHIRSQYSNSKPFTADTPTYEAIYTFNDVYGCWQNPDTYSKELTLELSWERGNGITQELDPQKVVFKRNVLTTVTINLNGASSNASLGINEEGTPMGAENIHISIEAGDPTDNTVNPKN